MLSLRSQMKLIPEVLSYVASEGELGKRQPDSKEKTDETSYFSEVSLQNGVSKCKCKVQITNMYILQCNACIIINNNS